MGFIKSREEKEQVLIEKFCKKFHLENIQAEDLEIVKSISKDLSGLQLMKAGLALSFTKATDRAMMGYLSALVQQNWLIIKKLDDVIKCLKK